MHYDASKFYIETSSGNYGSGTPATVNFASVPKSSNDPDVVEAVGFALKLSPATQYLPKQFYDRFNRRIAIFVKENPAGYHQGEVMTLKYDGQPEVAALVQGTRQLDPEFIPFYNHLSAVPFRVSCP